MISHNHFFYDCGCRDKVSSGKHTDIVDTRMYVPNQNIKIEKMDSSVSGKPRLNNNLTEILRGIKVHFCIRIENINLSFQNQLFN